MERTHESLWMAGSSTTEYPALDRDLTTDVAVIGGGITGLTTALLLAAEGLDVTLLEAHSVGSGTTGHTTGKVTALQSVIYQELEQKFGAKGARTYAEANVAAMAQIAELVETYEIACALERRDNFTYTTTPEQVETIEREARAASNAGLSVELTRETELPFEVVAAVRLRDQLQFDAYRYCVGLARAASSRGTRIFERSQVVDFDDDGERFVLATRGGARVTADRVVVATLLPVLDRGGFFAKAAPTRTYLMSFRTASAPPIRDMYISIDEPTRTMRSFAEFTIVGGHQHRVGAEPDTRKRYAEIESWAKRTFGFDGEPVHRWSSHDYMPIDEIPYIGRMPRSRDELMLATGFRKWGLTNGTAAAMILRDHVTGRDNPWSSFFSSTRLDVANSAAQFVKDNVEVARHFVGDRISNPTEREVDAIQPGEGGIARIDGKKLACFRDDSGTLHTLSPVCPHMGCHLTWNTAEKSWDCPCHGSRFDAHGGYLAGPAMGDMKPGKHGTD